MSDRGLVPVVDASPFPGVERDSKLAVARQITAARENLQFFCLTSHGFGGAHLPCVLPSAQL